MEEVRRLASESFLGNPLYLWVGCAVGFIGFLLILRMATAWIGAWARSSPALRGSKFGALVVSLLSRFSRAFLFAAALFVATSPLDLKEQSDLMLGRFLMLSFLLQSAIWGNTVLRYWLDYVFSRNGEDAATRNTVGLIGSLANGGMYTLLVLLALNNLGVDITALVAGLGVGGIAVALAAQNILGDLFASLTIVLDRPFAVGDSIKVGDSVGSVEHIGLKTTRLRGDTGEQLIFPNAGLLQNKIQNFRRMEARRVVTVLGLTYETPIEKLESVPSILREIVSLQKDARFERAHFKAYGASSLDFEFVFWIGSSDYNVFMDVQQAVNFQILRRFTAAGIGFAYPTQTVYAHRPSSG